MRVAHIWLRPKAALHGNIVGTCFHSKFFVCHWLRQCRPVEDGPRIVTNWHRSQVGLRAPQLPEHALFDCGSTALGVLSLGGNLTMVQRAKLPRQQFESPASGQNPCQL